jgi:hypothetical protein
MLHAAILRFEVIALSSSSVALGKRDVTLGAHLRKQGLQRCEIGWRLIGALVHAITQADSCTVVTVQYVA